MKIAKKITNEYIKTKDKNNKEVAYSFTKIFYEDGTTKSFFAINPVVNNKIKTNWEYTLKGLIDNYNDFKENNAIWKKNKNYTYTITSSKYLTEDNITDENKIEKVKSINITRVTNDKNDFAVINIATQNDEEQLYICDFDNKDDLMSKLVDNYDELESENKINIIKKYKKKENIEEEQNKQKIATLHFFLGNEENKDQAYIIHNGKSNYEKITIDEGLKTRDKIKNVTYQEGTTSESIDRDTFDNLYNKRKNSKKEIAHIVFYNFDEKDILINGSKLIDKGIKKTIQAMIFYTDGTVKNIDRDTAIELILKEFDKEKVSSLEELEQTGFIKFNTGKELTDNWNKYIEEAKNNSTIKKENTVKENINKSNVSAKKEDEKLLPIVPLDLKKMFLPKEDDNSSKDKKEIVKYQEADKEKKKKKKEKKNTIFSKIKKLLKSTWLKVVAVTAAFAMAANTIGYLAKSLFSNKEDRKQLPKGKISSVNINQEKSSNLPIIFNNSNDILNVLKASNMTRYNYLNNIGKELSDYNTVVANAYLENNKGTKLAHTFEEIETEYLLYNDLSYSDINKIYGKNKLSVDTLYPAFDYATTQDALAHNIQTKNIKKDPIFTSEEGKNFYKKYNDLFTKMNNKDDKSIKKEYMEKFYDMVRKDFNYMKDDSYEDIESYKLSVIEFIKAMDNMKIEASNNFSKKERVYIDGLYNNYAVRKINDICKAQNSYALVYGNEIEDDLPQVSDYRETIIKELLELNDYNIGYKQIDVTNYDSYNKHIHGIEIKKDTPTKEDTPTKVDTNKDVQTDTKVNTNKNIETANNKVIIPHEDIEKASEDIPSQIISNNQTKVEPIHTEPESKREVALDEYVEKIDLSDMEISEGIITYDEDVLSNGTLSKEYKDVTLDGEGAVSRDTKLPDPNNEVSLDEIYKETNNKVLVLK